MILSIVDCGNRKDELVRYSLHKDRLIHFGIVNENRRDKYALKAPRKKL